VINDKHLRVVSALFLLIGLLGFAAIIASAAPADPDPTFGYQGSGTATDYVPYVTVHKVLLQADGKIIVVGTRRIAYYGQPEKDYLFVRRYTTTGELETSFNTALKQGIGYDAEIQPDGKLVVIGQAPNTISSPFGGSTSAISPVVWRFNQNGTIDAGFGSNGARFINAHSGGSFRVEVFNTYIIILYASRPMFTLGEHTYKVSRLSATGNFDYTLTLPFQYAQYKTVTMRLDPLTTDIVVLSDAQLRRYTIAGTPAASFGTNGVATVPYCHSVPGLPFAPIDMEIQPDGGILVLRSYFYQNVDTVNLSRQFADGAADPTVCEVLSSAFIVGPDLLLQPDGRFFFFIGNGNGVRFFPDGSPAVSVSNHTRDPQAIQPDQKLVTATSTSSSIQLTRRLLD
jgi:uncharacterized delta-60 repeat protein